MTRDIPGMTVDVNADNRGMRAVRLGQDDYKRALVGRYLESSGASRVLKPAANPHVDLGRVDDESSGALSSSCRTHIGGGMFLARCTSPGLSYIFGILGRFADFWNASCDKRSHRVMSIYRPGMSDGLLGTFYDGDHGLLAIESLADADLGGCTLTRRSTSGWCIYLVGPHGSRMLLAWGSKRQAAAMDSTGVSEVTARNLMCKKDVLPISSMIVSLYGRSVAVRVLDDSDTARSSLQGGIAGKLNATYKHPGVVLSLYRD